MKRGQRLKRYCRDCGKLKEQVRDGMTQNGDLTWSCGTCLGRAWNRILQVMNAVERREWRTGHA